ncbi:FemAB superfamily protein [Geotalea daltonii FRC-32]|uniref:FemAB superfamily protein n=1 Tax=Geotalea daltonii (strain DSM 22248 / JCM 15807 / FRC-32) TaxID=316067 RepID=B9M2X2_GEODF|nr:FemAB family XrtA/PEP-CTERM system-associated protein [Geotalea daltonii]ACM21318.1 FemAB superfamily protein [Geotalea daltonii FRC-32]
MPISVDLITNSDSAWDAYVLGHDEGTCYHQYGWKEVIEKSFGHEAYFLAARGDSGKVCGVLPLVKMQSALFGRYLVSVPFCNYGGVLCDDTTVERLLINRAKAMREELEVTHVELRHLDKCLKGMATRSHKVTMILTLQENEAAQWKILDTKVRNQIRKAEKSRLKVITGHVELLDPFYRVFCRNMRDLGTPVYGKEFFRNIMETFPRTTKIVSVLLDGTTVASGIMMWFRDTVEVPWASSIKEYRNLCPNNLLYWEAIRCALKMRARRFDFGRSTPGEGTYRFKKQWGAEAVPLYWQYLIEEGTRLPQLNPSNPKYRTMIKVWQRLPLAVANYVGPKIVRGIP